MSTQPRWEPFGLPATTWDDTPQDEDGIKWVHLGSKHDRSARWLAGATAALGILAAAAAVVSFEAQYTMIYAARGNSAIAGLEAAIPDTAAVVFACLGIALALHGKRAIRARVLNVASVATSVTMNALAAGPGWRDWAIWIMPPVAYALASDTLIGVVRAHAIAQQRETGEALADDDATPLAVLTGVLLWVLRLALAPASTLTGFRGWVLDECPVAPGRRAIIALPIPDVTEFPCPDCGSSVALDDGTCAGCGFPEPEAEDEAEAEPTESKTARFLRIVERDHGPFAAIDLADVGAISRARAHLADLDTGAARSALRRRVLASQNGHGHA